jgi:hypothetical protein
MKITLIIVAILVCIAELRRRKKMKKGECDVNICNGKVKSCIVFKESETSLIKVPNQSKPEDDIKWKNNKRNEELINIDKRNEEKIQIDKRNEEKIQIDKTNEEKIQIDKRNEEKIQIDKKADTVSKTCSLKEHKFCVEKANDCQKSNTVITSQEPKAVVKLCPCQWGYDNVDSCNSHCAEQFKEIGTEKITLENEIYIDEKYKKCTKAEENYFEEIADKFFFFQKGCYYCDNDFVGETIFK